MNTAGKRHQLLPAVLLALLALTGPTVAGAEELTYKVKRSEISIPDGASLGDVRRTFRPFPNWTLICDENLKTRTKICNVTQSFVDNAGVTVFSWSLAASEGGQPVFILRAPAGVGKAGIIRIKPAHGSVIELKVDSCNATTCIAMLPVGARIREEIARAEPVLISCDAGKPMSFLAPLFGLAKAIEAIK